MSFEWHHFLDLAQDLVDVHGGGTEGGPQQAALRTAVSRAYYAAYHTVRDYVRATGRGDPPKGNSHTWVWSQLDNQRRQEGRMRREGFNLLKARTAADYDLDSVENWTKQATFHLATARVILKLVADIRPKA